MRRRALRRVTCDLRTGVVTPFVAGQVTRYHLGLGEGGH